MQNVWLTILLLCSLSLSAQDMGSISGVISDEGGAVAFASVYLSGTAMGTTSAEDGTFVISDVPYGDYKLVVSYVAYRTYRQEISVSDDQIVEIVLEKDEQQLQELVVTGTMKPVSKLESSVPVEVYSPAFFKANPTPSVYEAMQNVNGVRPQINCSVCNTGDIHINGLEGAYSMVMIDGMPIVSGLSTVYGLNGIPQSLIERVEIVKGPASTLYGSEAVAGLINVITKKPGNAALMAADVFATSWGEVNADLSTKFQVGEKAQSLIGVNYFNFQQPIDRNGDNFTDLTNQDRLSFFNKWSFERKQGRLFSLAARYVYEDRWGGELDWTAADRGGTEVYGESIYTSRWEVFGTYQLPIREKVLLMFSANGHDQNSVYGDTWYIANQKIGFGQLTWNKQLGSAHDLLAGAAIRYTYYDDNTPATASTELDNPENQPTHTYLPGLFLQDEISLNSSNKLLLGMRYDYNSLHGSIFTPRVNYKWSSRDKTNIVRLSFGTGYRVANVFTEDHAALTGAREVVFEGDLRPETSFNGNINYVRKIYTASDWYIGIDASAFYTYFNNKIFPDYDTNPNQIIYGNLDGHAVSNGISSNFEISYRDLNINAGATLMDVYSVQNGIRERQELTEQFTATWRVGYSFPNAGLSFDYTGNVYSPMELPVLGENDPRPAQSPWWSIQNIQVSKSIGNQMEIFGGVKNLLNWTPWKGLETDLIARAHDPFDQLVEFDADGQAIATPENPFGLTFDPAYVYAANQGIRGFLGFRYTIR